MNDTPQQPTPAASNYRCREHVECAVTWKGTGCPRCAGNLKRREATPPSDDYEQETHR